MTTPTTQLRDAVDKFFRDWDAAAHHHHDHTNCGPMLALRSALLAVEKEQQVERVYIGGPLDEYPEDAPEWVKNDGAEWYAERPLPAPVPGLVERLRAAAHYRRSEESTEAILREAADRLEKLEGK